MSPDSSRFFPRFSRAHFKFYPKGELVSEGMAFNTPDAKIRRTQHESTFENIIDVYKIKEPALEKIAQMIRTVEINYWEQRPDQVTQKLKDDVTAIINKEKNPDLILKRSFIIMDKLYSSINI